MMPIACAKPSALESTVPVPGSAWRNRANAWLQHRWGRANALAQRAFEALFLRRMTRDVYHLIGGHIFFQTVRSAVELGLFERLAEQPGMTREQLQASLELSEQPMRILLLGLVSLRLLKKKRGRFYNARITQICFLAKSPSSLTEIIRWQAEINYPAMPYLLESLRSGTNEGLRVFEGQEATLYERLGHQPDLASIFQRAMEQISRQANKHLRKTINLHNTSLLLDVGGGEGENVIALTERWPHLQAGVLDLPHVCRKAQTRFESLPQAGRLSAHPADCFKDEFPVGPDAFLFCHFLTIWSRAQNVALMKKAYRALPPGGKVFVFNMMQDNDESGPLGAALGSPYFLCLATGKGMLYTWKEYEAILREAGFTQIDRQRLPRQHGLITAHKGRG